MSKALISLILAILAALTTLACESDPAALPPWVGTWDVRSAYTAPDLCQDRSPGGDPGKDAPRPRIVTLEADGGFALLESDGVRFDGSYAIVGAPGAESVSVTGARGQVRGWLLRNAELDAGTIEGYVTFAYAGGGADGSDLCRVYLKAGPR